jgi:hypothetical protein
VEARAAEPVVQIDVALGGIQIVLRHQCHGELAQMDAFGIGGRAGERAGDVGDVGCLAFVGLGVLLLGRLVVAIGLSKSRPREAGPKPRANDDDEATQNCICHDLPLPWMRDGLRPALSFGPSEWVGNAALRPGSPQTCSPAAGVVQRSPKACLKCPKNLIRMGSVRMCRMHDIPPQANRDAG